METRIEFLKAKRNLSSINTTIDYCQDPFVTTLLSKYKATLQNEVRTQSKQLIDETEFCTHCERDLPHHYTSCPLY